MASTAKPQELDERLLPEAAPTILQQTVPRIAENRMATARATLAPMVADMTSVAGLSNYEADQLLTVMAESLLRGKDAQSECSATPGCDISKIRPELQRARRREIERILPLAKLQRLDYMDENARVKVFRSDLPSGLGLSETLANELALSLSEERYRFAGEDETNEAFNSRLYLRAQRLLTAEQLAKFKELQSTLFARDN